MSAVTTPFEVPHIPMRLSSSAVLSRAQTFTDINKLSFMAAVLLWAFLHPQIELVQSAGRAAGSVSSDAEHLNQLLAVGVDKVSGFFSEFVLGFGVSTEREQEPKHHTITNTKYSNI